MKYIAFVSSVGTSSIVFQFLNVRHLTMIVDFDLKIELEVYQDLQFGYFWYQNITSFGQLNLVLPLSSEITGEEEIFSCNFL